MAPGATCEVELEVFNTGEVIDTVTSRVVGSYPLAFEQRPGALSLFPGTSERVVVAFTLPTDFPAGGHVLPVEVVSAVAPELENIEIQVALEVAPVVKASMDLVPSEMTCGRRGRFSAHVANDGNMPLNLSLTGLDPERALTFSFDPVFIRVQPGQHVYIAARTTGKRPFFGLPLSRQFNLHADGPGVAISAPGRVNQKPWIARGVITILTLMLILGLWAAVFTAGAELVLNRDALTKSVPTAFLSGEQDFNAAVVGGTMTGTITALTNGSPVERMTVEAYLLRRGRQELVQSAASLADGTWTVDGLLPGRYYVRFTAPGYQETWYPQAPDRAGASIVPVRPVAESEGLDVVVQGLPGSITGALAAGEQSEILGFVTVRPLVEEVAGEVVAVVPTNPDGTFMVPDLPTPAEYQLTVSLDGFTDQVVATPLGGGAHQVINTVQMIAGDGVLGGVVSSGGEPLGGVVITVVGGGATYTAATPTSGPVGQWSLGGLPTPATYVVTFTLEGFGTQTMALDLFAGETRDDVDISMVSGTGSISGEVRSPTGTLGDVTVTVTGSATPIVTKTLTTGDIGAYTLTGLVTPGRYTVTFTLEGYAPVTRAVTLGDSGLATGIDVTLSRSTGSIAGTITAGGASAAGATINLGDGRIERSTVSADIPQGGYRFDALPPGTYTITVELPGFRKRTVLVTVTAGGTITSDIAMVAA